MEPEASPTVTSISCPQCRLRGLSLPLTLGASLEGSTCMRCGGTLLPTTGSERLLHDELALDRAALVDLAESFGGRRFGCPSCSARMRSLLLRGVDVDLCFHCGSIWLEQGELERLSGNRHRGLAPAPQEVRPTALVVRPEATVRLDARHPVPRAVGSVVGSLGVVVGLGSLLELLPPVALAAAAALVVTGALFRRRSIVDVFPRARRVLRSRKWMPGLPHDENAERLDEKNWVLVRPFGTSAMAAASFVDGVGRVIAPLDMGGRRKVLKLAKALAKKLGTAVVVDPRLERDARPTPSMVDLGGDLPFTIHLKRGPSAFWIFEAATLRRAPVFTLQNAVPARGNEGRSARLALCFCLEGPRGTRLRFHDDGAGYTVIVGNDGEPVGAIQRRSGAGFDWLSFALAGRAERVHLLVPPIGRAMTFVDDAAARYGRLEFDQGQLIVTINANVNADIRFACVVLAAHAALDAGRLIEGH